LTVTDPFVAELVGAAALDFVMIDTEHSPLGPETLQSMLIALRTSQATSLVRVAANDQTLIEQALDLGAESVIVPDITDRASCSAAVAAARYSPSGTRGFGPRRAARLEGGRAAYLEQAAAETLVVVMIEHIDALANLAEILTTPGLDGILVGPADLAVSMGHLREPTHPDVTVAIDQVLAECRRLSVPFGVFAAADAAARDWVARGAVFILAGGDVQFLDAGVRRSAELATKLRSGAARVVPT
jgi:2-keto-3-deoxy-L-rhamnonate aldolase RhmA